MSTTKTLTTIKTGTGNPDKKNAQDNTRKKLQFQ